MYALLDPPGTDGDLWVWCLDQRLSCCLRNDLDKGHLCLRLLVKDVGDK